MMRIVIVMLALIYAPICVAQNYCDQFVYPFMVVKIDSEGKGSRAIVCATSKASVHQPPTQYRVDLYDKPSEPITYLPLRLYWDFPHMLLLANQNNKHCNSFDLECALRCANEMVEKWKSVCSKNFDISISTNKSECQGAIQISPNPGDFKGAIAITHLKVAMSKSMNTYVIYASEKGKAMNPKILFNTSAEYEALDYILSTDCPCLIDCYTSPNEFHGCLSFCNTMLHELGHIFGISDTQGSGCSPIPQEYYVMAPDAVWTNHDQPFVGEACKLELSAYDRCLMCKTNCPDDCCLITSILVERNIFVSRLNVEVYPNPTSGIITMVLEEGGDPYEAIIVDGLGRTLYLGHMSNKPLDTIDLNELNLHHGVYYLLISRGEERAINKIIIE